MSFDIKLVKIQLCEKNNVYIVELCYNTRTVQHSGYISYLLAEETARGLAYKYNTSLENNAEKHFLERKDLYQFSKYNFQPEDILDIQIDECEYSAGTLIILKTVIGIVSKFCKQEKALSIKKEIELLIAGKGQGG